MASSNPPSKSALQRFLGAASPDKVVPLVGVHLNVASYAFCYWLTRPVEPFLLEKLGGSAQSFGLLQSWFSFLMLLGGPFIGRVCDSKGAHIGLMVCQMGAALGYGFTGLARNLPLLFLARVPQVFMHVMQASQAVVAHCANDDARAVAMGRLSLSYRVGMVAGSVLGGTLALRVGNAGVMLLGALVSALSLPFTYICVPASSVKVAAAAASTASAGATNIPVASEDKQHDGLNLGRIVEVMRAPAVRRLITMHVALSLGQDLLGPFSPTTSSVLKEAFGLDAQQLGLTMSLQSLVGLFANVFLIGPIARWHKNDEFAMVRSGAIVNAVCAAAFSLARRGNLLQVYAVLAPICLANSVTSTTVASLYSKSCDQRDAGTCIALQHAVGTFLGIFLPTAGTYMYANLGGVKPVAFGSAACLLFAGFIIKTDRTSGEKSN